jgi:hypothetical protein
MAARERLAALLRDASVGHDDKRVREDKTEIEHAGVQREHCAVFVQEFGRTPDREFHLSLGDVVYFGLAPLAASPGAGKKDGE